MIPYIGDISRADAFVLSSQATIASRILEFGVGASTQVLREYSSGAMTSVDTDSGWIERTKSNLALLQISKPVDFVAHDAFRPDHDYDLVFIDGADELRLPFAIAAWSALMPGGKLLFHDTRRHRDFLYLTQMVAMYEKQIQSVALNLSGSNISALTKRVAPATFSEDGMSFPAACFESDKAAVVFGADIGVIARLEAHFQRVTIVTTRGNRPPSSVQAIPQSATERMTVRVDEFSSEGRYDLVVVEEIEERWFPAVTKLWAHLPDGGHMLIGGTSEPRYTMEVLLRRWTEIGSLIPRNERSEFSVIQKRAATPYVNWNEVEQRQPWEFGGGEPDVEVVKERLMTYRHTDQSCDAETQ